MAPDLRELLRSAVPDHVGDPDFDRIGVDVRRRRLLRRSGIALAAVVVAVAVVGGASALQPRTRSIVLDAPSQLAPRVTDTVDLGKDQQGTALVPAEDANGGVWVASLGADGPSVLHVDTGPRPVLTSVPLSGVPLWEVGGGGMARDGGTLWVVGTEFRSGGTEQGVVQGIDIDAKQVTTDIALGEGSPADLAVNATGIWVAMQTPDGSVRALQIDPAAEEVVASVDIEGGWVRDILAVNGHVAVHSATVESDTVTDSVLTMIDAVTAQVLGTYRASEPLGPFVVVGDELWGAAGDRLVRFDSRTAEPTETRQVPKTVSKASLAADSDGIWFVGYDPDDDTVPATIDRYDIADRTVDVSIDPPRSPNALAIDEAALWVLNNENSVTRIQLHP